MRSVRLLFALLFPAIAFSQKAIKLSSPDGKITFSFSITKKEPLYSVSYNGKPLITNASLGLIFAETGAFRANLKVGSPSYASGEEKYELVTGKAGSIVHPYKEMRVSMSETGGASRKVYLTVKIFNDGLGFRYEFPSQDGMKNFSLADEQTSFRFNADPKLLALLLPNYKTSHEGEYSHLLLSELKEDTLMDMPALIEFPSGVYMAITEASLHNYAGMYLSKHNGELISKLSPLPSQPELKVKTTLPHQSPWRVLMISDRIGTLIESNILTSLSEPCKIEDLSWIKPGKTTFPWWNGNVTPDTLNAPGNNFVTNQYYIDFCARNGIEYHSVVEYGLHQWYVDDGTNFQPGPNADVTKAVPGLDMKEVCDYARKHGVNVRVWVHWAALYPKLDAAFAKFEEWGLTGMMVDFMDRDDQEMVNIQEEMLRKAAKHRLHIQFHGAYKPTGMNRTWPNEYTREGTLNYEVNKWGSISPDHDVDIVFTRGLAGQTDYHLGGFRAVPDSIYRIQYTRPLMLGTRCHMMAMYVVLQNALGMVCDYPAAYEGESGFDFIKAVPTTWDETKVPDARIGEYAVIARRKRNDWYVGAINNKKARQLSIPLNFLSEGEYIADIYTDADDASVNPNHLKKETKTVTPKDNLIIHLASGGGMTMSIRKK